MLNRDVEYGDFSHVLQVYNTLSTEDGQEIHTIQYT